MPIIVFLLIGCTCTEDMQAQVKPDSLLQQLLLTNRHKVFQQVISEPGQYRLQIIYTRIDRDKKNKPHFTQYQFNVDSTLYFNPASTVKLPAAMLALEKINMLHMPAVNMYTTLRFDSNYIAQKPLFADSTSPTGKPSLAHFIRRAFIVSENEPYSRMYEMVGQQYFNRRLQEMGYTDTRIMHRFVRMSPEENRHTNAVHFINKAGKIVYTQPPAYNRDSFSNRPTEVFGKGYLTSSDSLVHAPFDFRYRNRISLPALNNILKAVLFPDAVPAKEKFNLTTADLQYLRQYLSQYPRETNYPKYDPEKFFDSNVKFFFMDSAHQTLPEYIRVFNKAGWAYGFLTDIAYVADFKNKVEFMLSVTVYVNSDGILNDGKYDYKTVGHPFLSNLGQTIYRHELKRKRKYPPDLTEFKINYEKR